MSSPFFSIIMPVYNTGKYILNSINSVIDQSFTDFELICVNDNTKDDAFEICKDAAKLDSRIVCVDSNNNVGLSKTRNKGLKLFKGEYVLFLDSDDVLDLDTLKSIYEIVTLSNPECVIFGYKMIYDSGKIIEKKSNIANGYYDKKTFYSLMLNGMDHPFISCVGTKAYKKSVIRDNNLLFNASHLYNEDIGFCLNAFILCNSFYYIDKCFYSYYQRTGSIMSSYKPNMFSNIMSSRELYLRFFNVESDEPPDVNQSAYFFERVVIGGAFESLRNEKKFSNKKNFNSEVSNIKNHYVFKMAYCFVAKHKSYFPFVKRVFIFLIKKQLSKLLWRFIK